MQERTDGINPVKGHKRFLINVAWGLLPFFLVLSLWPFFRLMVDATGSLGGGMFFVVVGDRTFQREDIAVFYPPMNPFFASDEEFIKQVGGIPGDVIQRNGRDFTQAGKYLGTAKTTSRHGKPLQAFTGGVVPEGHYYFYSKHPDAFDSRYQEIGFVAKEQVIGQAYRIF